jgi:hypothetical protein
MDQEEIRRLVREKLAAGALPREECQTASYEYECQTPDGVVVTLCQPCYLVWQQERARPGR